MGKSSKFQPFANQVQKKNTQQQLKSKQTINQPQQSKEKQFQLLNIAFASKKVLVDFLLYSFLIIIIPVICVSVTYSYVKDNSNYSQLDKVVLAVGPSLLFINILIGVYIYKVIKDPQNYKKDQPLKVQIPVGFKQQSMNRRKNLKSSSEQQTEIKDQQTKYASTKQNASTQNKKKKAE